MTVVGNRNGYVGLGFAGGPPRKHQEVIQKSVNRAKLNIIPVRRGCGSWECLCGTGHSIPFSVRGKSGSVEVVLYPAPRGIGLVVPDEIKKIMRFAGISDIWSKSRGQTATRVNHARAVFHALKNLSKFKVQSETEKHLALITGKAI
jgi:small subunit ribosomal protein S5